MSQQGERRTGPSSQEDDWWGKLYDDESASKDTGPTPTPDTLDDRFTSADEATGGPARPSETPPPPHPDAVPRTGEAPGQEGAPSAPEPPRPEAAPRVGRPPVPESAPRVEKPPGPEAASPESGPGRPEVGPLRGEAAGPEAGSSPLGPPRPESAPLLGETPEPPRPEAAPSPSEPPWPEATAFLREGDSASLPPRPEVPPAAPAASRPEPAQPPPDAPSVEAPPPPPEVSAVVVVPYVGDEPPTYDAEPTALPQADPEGLGELVADTVLDGARCGASTLRAVSVRGDSARYRGEPRRDSLLTARFGSGASALILVAMATGARATPGAHRAAAEVCEWIGRAVGLSHTRLAEDVRAGRRGDLKSGLHRLTDRSLGKLRAGATEQGLDPDEYAATLRCLLLPADPACRTRVFFGVGGGGLFRLRDGEWRDIEPSVPEQRGAPVVGFGSSPPAETPDGDRLTMDLNITTPPSPYEPAPPPPRDAFRFRASVARPGDTLLLCSPGLADPLRGEPDLARHLANRWADTEPPGLAAFLADAQVRVKGYADDRTAAAVWEA
ncbi:protein phosphatase 2C domain-containing protein [Streptomyces sp. NPDC006422]|uniref:protein phosphatase 2C domain-containing protein n=1 Tax=unclassified Streptomyces TaxID=2593676 RepID=UPI0033A0D1B8